MCLYYAVGCERLQCLRKTPKQGKKILGTPVCRECCVTEHTQAVRHNVCSQPSFRTRPTAQDVHRFVPNIVTDNVDLPLYNEPIKFSPRIHKRYFFNLQATELNPISHLLAILGARPNVDTSRIKVNIHFNIILKSTHTYFSCSVSCQEHKWNIFCPTNTNILIYTFN